MAANGFCGSVDHRCDETSQLGGRHEARIGVFPRPALRMDGAVTEGKLGARGIAHIRCVH